LVGDIHQPMHAEDNGDKGGNEKLVMLGENRTNLHTLWDSILIDGLYGLPIAHKDQDPNKNYKIDLQPALEAHKKLVCAEKIEQLTPKDWAEESHRLAQAAYQKLPADFTPGWENAYAGWAGPVISCQLMKAGVRLAELLKEALP